MDRRDFLKTAAILPIALNIGFYRLLCGCHSGLSGIFLI